MSCCWVAKRSWLRRFGNCSDYRYRWRKDELSDEREEGEDDNGGRGRIHYEARYQGQHLIVIPPPAPRTSSICGTLCLLTWRREEGTSRSQLKLVRRRSSIYIRNLSNQLHTPFSRLHRGGREFLWRLDRPSRSREAECRPRPGGSLERANEISSPPSLLRHISTFVGYFTLPLGVDDTLIAKIACNATMLRRHCIRRWKMLGTDGCQHSKLRCDLLLLSSFF